MNHTKKITIIMLALITSSTSAYGMQGGTTHNDDDSIEIDTDHCARAAREDGAVPWLDRLPKDIVQEVVRYLFALQADCLYQMLENYKKGCKEQARFTPVSKGFIADIKGLQYTKTINEIVRLWHRLANEVVDNSVAGRNHMRAALCGSVRVDGRTLLHDLADQNRSKVVLAVLLAAKRMEVRTDYLMAKDVYGDTALHYALSPGLENYTNVTTLLAAAHDEGIRAWLLSTKNTKGQTVLHKAATYGKEIRVERKQTGILDREPNNICIHDAPAAIITAAQDEGILAALLTCKDCQGWTALHHACWTKYDEMVIDLLAAAKEQGVCAQMLVSKDNDGFTALHRAYYMRGNHQIVKILVAAARDQGVLDVLQVISGDACLALPDIARQRRPWWFGERCKIKDSNGKK